MYLFGYQTIHAWNEQLAVAAADLFSELVAEKLRQHGGYMVSRWWRGLGDMDAAMQGSLWGVEWRLPQPACSLK